MADLARICCGVGFVLLVIGMGGGMLLSFASLATMLSGSPDDTALSFFGSLLLFPLLIAGCLLLTIGFVLYLLEIVKAKNPEDWRVKWFAIVFVLSLIGVVAYEIWGRKERLA